MTNCRFVASDQPRVIKGRHAVPCVCDGEFGCLECPEPHCLVCGKEHARAACAGCLGAARSDLRAIRDLCLGLEPEAIEKGAHSEAAMLNGPAADPEAWQNVAMSAVRGRLCRCIRRLQLCPSLFGKTCPDEAFLDDNRDELHPLFILGGWEQVWRDFLDHPTDTPVTVELAAGYLDLQIGYMADQLDPAFDEFAKDLRACRGHLEDVLRDGEREERTQVPCTDCRTRLVKVYALKASDDHWRCPSCHRTYNAEEFARARHFHLDDNQPARFVKVSVALGMIDRHEQTLRTWMANEKVKTERDESGALMVWWPDVWAMHRDTPARRRRSA